jgi:hypothetical protein
VIERSKVSEFASYRGFEDIAATLWTQVGCEQDEKWTKSLSTSKDEVT